MNNEPQPRKDEDFLYETNRLVEISDSLRSLQKKCRNYLEVYEKSADWKTFKQGFLGINVQVNPKDITNIEVCSIGASPENLEMGYLSPDSKKLTICSNKVLDYNHFRKIMNYQMTHLYDMYRADIDYSKCEQLACMKIRALNLSGVCRKKKPDCFKRFLENTLFQKEICEGKLEEVFKKVFHSCSVDFSPFNEMKFQSNFMNF